MKFKEVTTHEVEECSFKDMLNGTFFARPKTEKESDLCMKIDIDFYYNFSAGELICFNEDINEGPDGYMCRREVVYTIEHIFTLAKILNLPEEITWKKKTKEKVSKGV